MYEHKKVSQLWGEYESQSSTSEHVTQSRPEASQSVTPPPALSTQTPLDHKPTDTKPREDKEEEEPTDIKSSILRCVACSSGFFCSQQRGEPELSRKEKEGIAQSLLEHKPAQFLARFGQFLSLDQLVFFQPLQGDYEVAFRLKELRAAAAAGTNQKLVKNRRFQALKRMLESNSSYFSLVEMRRRNPLLYTQLVGRFLSAEEKAEVKAQEQVESRKSLAELLLSQMDQQEMESWEKSQADNEDNIEEHDSDSDSDEDEQAPMEADGEQMTEEEKLLLRQEFVSAMYENFLQGRDKDFNYSDVDTNADLDDLDALDRDAEDKYFESEEYEEDPRSGNDQNVSDDLDDYMQALQGQL